MASSEIMLIDDDNIPHFLLKSALKKLKLDYTVIYHSNPEDALNDLANRKPEDLPLFVILDVDMPQMNAWQFLDKYDFYEHKAKIIVLTSSIRKLEGNKAIEHKHILSFHIKPLSEDELIRIINLCTP